MPYSVIRTVCATLLALALSACQSAPPRQAMVASPPVAVLPTVAYAPVVPEAAEERGRAALVMDMDSGAILFAQNADAMRYPASLTKMMTLYLLFEAASAGRVSLDEPLPVSATAAAMPPARIGLKAGSSITARDAAQALAVRSANDVAVVIAERLAGSQSAFAAQMTATARQLGMTRTRFVNATGLPDTGQVTTARDMAVLGRALKTRFPQHGAFFTARAFRHGGRTFEATNNLLGRVAGVDGIKTGYIRMSGYNLVASARRGGRGLIAVVMGGESEKARDAEVAALLERYF